MGNINATANELARKFQSRLDAGEHLSFVDDEAADDQMFTLDEYIPRGRTSVNGFITICNKVLQQLGGKGPLEGQSQFYIEEVWARLFVGTEKESPSDEIRIILKMRWYAKP